jgi:hypothetical protein
MGKDVNVCKIGFTPPDRDGSLASYQSIGDDAHAATDLRDRGRK